MISVIAQPARASSCPCDAATGATTIAARVVVGEKDDVKAGASAGGGSRSISCVSYQWASPTFTPDNALEGAAWIRDNSAVRSIVRQRQATNLVRFEEVATVDTSFAIDIAIADVFSAGLKWARQSTYRFMVEFFDKRETG